MTFREWLDEVDSFAEDTFGLGIDDLPDMTYREWYDDGLEPEEALDNMMDELGWLEE